jgi:Fe2+ transport system protein FeoA
MEVGESGKIIKVIADKGKQERFDREWIKEGNTIDIMHRLEPESIPLLVKVGDKSHVIGAGLTEKIFVEETTLSMT